MPIEPRYRVESHQRAATLYVSGPFTVATALGAVRLCEALPHPVVELRVDLRIASLADTTPVQVLAMMLARWRRSADGRRTRLDLPPTARRPRPPLPRAKPPRGTRAPSGMRQPVG